MSFLNCFENNGILRRMINITSNINRIIKSNMLERINAIILKENTINILVMGCSLAKIEFEGI